MRTRALAISEQTDIPDGGDPQEHSRGTREASTPTPTLQLWDSSMPSPDHQAPGGWLLCHSDGNQALRASFLIDGLLSYRIQLENCFPPNLKTIVLLWPSSSGAIPFPEP